MRCSRCGARNQPGSRQCGDCGARFRRSVAPRPSAELPTCPRCGHCGEAVPYFSRGLHSGMLLGATLLTIGVLGAGGLVYYLVRRDHQICARCGYGFGSWQERRLVAGGAPAVPETEIFPSAGGEWMRRGFGIALLVLGALLLASGAADRDTAELLVGAASAIGGALLVRAAAAERQNRRRQIVAALQRPVLRLAAESGGRLTATAVAAELGWSIHRAKKILDTLELSDALRVNSEVTDEGVIVYEFRELMEVPGQRSLPG